MKTHPMIYWVASYFPIVMSFKPGVMAIAKILASQPITISPAGSYFHIYTGLLNNMFSFTLFIHVYTRKPHRCFALSVLSSCARGFGYSLGLVQTPIPVFLGQGRIHFSSNFGPLRNLEFFRS